MNYQRIYNNLIIRAKNRILEGYSEKHHIIPEHFFINRTRKGPKGWLEGNPDEPNNLVFLTGREHYIAHQLLVKIYPNQLGLIFSAKMMTVGNEFQENRSKNKWYSWLKEEYSKINGQIRKNKSYEEQYGKEKAKRIRKMQSNALKGISYIEKFGEEKALKLKKEKSLMQKGISNKEKYGDKKAKELSKLNGKNRKGKSWVEQYGTEKANKLQKHLSESLMGHKRLPAKEVVCIETDQIFRNCREAAKFVGLKSYNCIWDVCKGNRKTAKGLHWKFLIL